MKKLLWSFVFGLSGMAAAVAQDLVYFRNGDIIEAKVQEILADTVKYHLYGYENGPQLLTTKTALLQILFENGTTIHMTSSTVKPYKWEVLKMGVFAPICNHVALTYERAIIPGSSVELTLGYIGAGYRYAEINGYGDRKVTGALVRLGWKFIFTTQLSRSEDNHPLHGFYFRPDILLGLYRQRYIGADDYTGVETLRNDRVAYASALVTIGKQWISEKRLSVDMFIGGGYHASSLPKTQFYNNGCMDFGVISADIDYSNQNVAFAGGVRLGIALR